MVLVVSSKEVIVWIALGSDNIPVEKLWQHMKDCILKNKVYDTLQELEDVALRFLKMITSNTIKTVCNCLYV